MSRMFANEEALQSFLKISYVRERLPPPIVRTVSPQGIEQPSAVHQQNAKARVKKTWKGTINYKAVLMQQMALAGLPVPVAEFKFAEDIKRKWRIDIAYPDLKLAIEIEGMAHRTRERFMADIEKYNELVAIRGWRLLRIYTRWITSEKRENTKGIDLVLRAFNG